MSDSPRRNTQANRQARRQSPYTRPTQPPTQPEPTPSRLRSLLSYVSPFRSARKHKAPTPEPDDEPAVKEELDSSDEGAAFALHGRLLPRGRDFADHAPPSPTPGTSSGSKASANSLASSASLPNLAATLATPRFGRAVDRSPSYARFADSQSALTAESAVHSTSSHATQELARFFQAKANRGEEQLTPVEQAGVLHLMQQAHGDSSVPTAFTPNFRSNPPDALAQPVSQAGSSSGSVFGGELPSSQATGPVVSKRRRPMYVGAGYSSRRRRATIAGVSQSQSEAALSSGPDASEGKRRKTGRDAEDDIPVATLDDVVVSPAPVRTLTSQRAPAIPAIAAKDPIKSASAKLAGTSASSSTSTPAKPSPLWQVSQADVPSPSPPRKSAPARPPTRAADLMLDIIRKEDAAHPPPSTSPKAAILNPYASNDNPLALAGAGRPTRTKAKSSTPRPAQRVSKVTAEVEKLKQKAQEESPLEQLERTMPAEYRRESKRSKPAEQPKPSVSKAAAPAIAPKKASKKAPAVVELSSDAEDAEMGGAEEEDEEEEEEEEEDQLVDDQAEDLPAPAFAFGTSKKGDAGASSKPTTPFSFAPPAPAPPSSAPSSAKPAFAFGSSTSGFSFGAPSTSGFAPASAGAAKPATTGAFTFGGATTGATSTAAAPVASPAFSFGIPAPEPLKTTSPAAANVPLAPPVLPPPAATPMAALADVASKAHAATSTQHDGGGDANMDAEGASEGEKDPQAAARALSKAQLPLAQFSFAGLASSPEAGARSRGGEVDKALEAVKDLVTGMSRSELPSFAF